MFTDTTESVEVEDITHLNLSGVDKGKLYYVLAPLNKKESRIYYPVDRERWTRKAHDHQSRSRTVVKMKFRGLH